MSDEERRFVLRTPGTSADPSTTTETPTPGPTPTQPKGVEAPATHMSGSLPPVTISEIKAPPPVPPPASRRVGLGMLGAGSIMMCLFPTLPWFGVQLRSLPQGEDAVGFDLPAIAGIRTWAGLACLLGGIAVTALLILMLLPNWEKKREALGLFAGGLGALVGLIGVYAMTFATSLTGFSQGADTTIWVALTAAGGFVAAVGGFLVRD